MSMTPEQVASLARGGRLRTLKPAAQAALFVYANTHGNEKPSPKAIASAMGVTDRYAKKCLSQLREAKVLGA